MSKQRRGASDWVLVAALVCASFVEGLAILHGLNGYTLAGTLALFGSVLGARWAVRAR